MEMENTPHQEIEHWCFWETGKLWLQGDVPSEYIGIKV